MSRVRPLIERLIHDVLEAFPPGIDYPRTVFDRAPMPPVLAHFLSRTLDHCSQIEIERLRGTASEWFDGDTSDATAAREQWLAALHRHAQVPASEWERMVEQAAHTTIGYLIRPASTLVKFVFQNEAGPLAAPVVRRRVSYFQAYSYLADAVHTYFSQKAVLHIEQERFASLLHRVDRHLTDDYSPERWATLLKPLYETVGTAEGLPTGVLRLFFHEKGRAYLEDRLYQAERRDNCLSLTPDALIEALAAPSGFTNEEEVEVLPEVTPSTAAPTLAMLAPVAPPPADPAPPLPDIAEEDMAAAPLPDSPPDARATPDPAPPLEPLDLEPPAVDHADGLVPLWKQFQSRNDTAPSPAEPSSLPPTGDAEPEPLWKQFQRKREDAAPPVAPSSVSTVATEAAPTAAPAALSTAEHTVLGEAGGRQREQFIKHLFDGSEADYLAFVEQLIDEPTWATTSQRIAQEVFRPRRINIYSPVAVAFTDAAEARFRTA